jgi:hypothetical protein
LIFTRRVNIVLQYKKKSCEKSLGFLLKINIYI